MFIMLEGQRFPLYTKLLVKTQASDARVTNSIPNRDNSHFLWQKGTDRVLNWVNICIWPCFVSLTLFCVL